MRAEPKDPLTVVGGELDSGVELFVQRSPAETSSFSATFLAPGGWAYDPPKREGLGLLANSLLTSGAGRRDRVAFSRELDRRGATMNERTEPESIELTVWGPATEFGPLLDLLADAVLRPRFASEDLERVRRQLRERQLREEAQPDDRAERELFRRMFPVGHPYRLTGLGDADSLSAIRRAEVVRFHRRQFPAQGSLIVVTGPWGRSRIQREVERRFRDFATARPPPPPRIPASRSPHSDPVRISMPGRSQVEVRLGGPSIARASAEFPGVTLANEVLGGRPLLSRLFQRVRERHGLAYHASSDVEAMRWGGHWMAQAGTGPERVDRVIRMVTEEVRRISVQSPPSAELDRIRESAIGALPLALESTAGAHELALDIAYHHLTADFYREWPAVLRAVTPRQVRDAAHVGMDVGRSVTVVAGP